MARLEDLQIGSQKKEERDMTDVIICLKISNSQVQAAVAEYRREDGLIVGDFKFKLSRQTSAAMRARLKYTATITQYIISPTRNPYPRPSIPPSP